MTELYELPLTSRYASKEMGRIFSEQHRYACWRGLWIALAKAEQGVGLPITDEQIAEMELARETIDFARAREHEQVLRHDVMAHIHAYAEQCPAAGPILHLGATSCLITDNADVLLLRDGMRLLIQRLNTLLTVLAKQAERYKSVPCLSFTHFQAAAPTTVGRRLALWAHDFLIDLQELTYRLQHLKFLGVKGATGTQASFLDLLEGDDAKVHRLEQLFMRHLGGGEVFPISGQTYSRKQDAQLLDALAGVATTAHKMGTDIRLLAHLREVEEPFGRKQVGSSAMPYKRNPMLCERACSLARYLMSLSENPKYTAATQWFERTLDDSANRRLCIPQAFLAADAILCLLIQVTTDLVVNTETVAANLSRELPLLAMERILMLSVQKGGNRQATHERLRLHAMASRAAPDAISLVKRIAEDPEIPLEHHELEASLEPNQFIGRSARQVSEFLRDHLYPQVTEEEHHADRPVL